MSMALVPQQQQRRHLNLRLPLPEPRPRFPLPLPPSSDDSDISPDDLDKLHVLGHGNAGTVYKVRHRRTSAIYALKLIQLDSDPVTRSHVRREMEILRRTDSPHVVRYHGFFEKAASGEVGIVMEYMDMGTVETMMKKKKGGRLSESEVAAVARQVLSGLSYLQSKKIIHRDIKPSNLLVNGKKEVKIGDFGVSKVMWRSIEACNSYVGTCAYMSPERFNPDSNDGGKYDGYAGDIWSLGLTLFELYLGHFPLLSPAQKADWVTLMCAICYGEPPALPHTASQHFRSFIHCCLNKDPKLRWTASQLLNHPFLN